MARFPEGRGLKEISLNLSSSCQDQARGTCGFCEHESDERHAHAQQRHEKEAGCKGTHCSAHVIGCVYGTRGCRLIILGG